MSDYYQDEQGRWRLPVKHHMGRRRSDWHYNWTGLYMITLTLADRSRPILGRLVGESGDAQIVLSELGESVARLWQTIGDFHPEVEPLDFQVMPDHFHGILRVCRQMDRPLGTVVGGFKAGCTKAYRALLGAAQGGNHTLPGAAQAAPSLWAPGFVDSIAFNAARLARQIAYIKDNPRRLALKRANRDLFRVVQRVPFHGGFVSALGNLFLLDAPQFVQVQCSRSISPSELAQKQADCLCCAQQGAVLVSPCLSPGEKQIARAAFEARVRLIVLKNTGFAPLAKPGGAYFDACAEGRLLMLAPSAWPYSTQRKPLTRVEACVLNRIAQVICGDDAVEINYHGLTPTAIDHDMGTALGVARNI